MKDDQSCVIYGAGGHGRVVADAAIAAGHRVLGFIDDNIPEGSVILAKPDLELRVLGKPACIKTYPRESIAIGLGIGSNEVGAVAQSGCLGVALLSLALSTHRR